MRSDEVLKRVVEDVGVKSVAADLGVSTSLVYKWCARPASGLTGSGARNPLDRLLSLVESTGNRHAVEWLCAQVGGYFVESTEAAHGEVDAHYIRHTQTLLAEFSDLLQVMSDSIASEGRVDRREANAIRQQWHRLQARGEAFVRACEAGQFDPERS